MVQRVFNCLSRFAGHDLVYGLAREESGCEGDYVLLVGVEVHSSQDVRPRSPLVLKQKYK